MHTVELFEQACRVARELGYEIRHEWLGGTDGGACEFGGKRWLFVDLSLTHVEQLEQVVQALANDAGAAQCQMPSAVRQLVRPRKAA